MYAKVKRRVRDEEGNPVGRADNNPLLDSRKYKVEYVNRHVEELTANAIAENLIAQVDEEGQRQMMMSEIIDYRVLPEAIPQAQGTYVNQYAMNRNLQDEPAFAWWLPYTLKKEKRILQKIKSKYWSRTHKYGIRMPWSIKEAIKIDKENGNTLWMDASCLNSHHPSSRDVLWGYIGSHIASPNRRDSFPPF